MIAALFRVTGDPVGSFPGWAEFTLGRVFGCQGDLVQDDVPYVKSSELHSLVVVLDHLLLVLRHSFISFIFDLVQAVQVDL